MPGDQYTRGTRTAHYPHTAASAWVRYVTAEQEENSARERGADARGLRYRACEMG